MATTLRISNFSTYKDTKVYTDPLDHTPVFALMEAPPEFTDVDEGTGTAHTVAVHEIGFLDALAVRYYGPGYERLWRVIAIANAMVDPEREMYAGQTIVIPSRTSVLRFLSRAGDAVTST